MALPRKQYTSNIALQISHLAAQKHLVIHTLTHIGTKGRLGIFLLNFDRIDEWFILDSILDSHT